LWNLEFVGKIMIQVLGFLFSGAYHPPPDEEKIDYVH